MEVSAWQSGRVPASLGGGVALVFAGTLPVIPGATPAAFTITNPLPVGAGGATITVTYGAGDSDTAPSTLSPGNSVVIPRAVVPTDTTTVTMAADGKSITVVSNNVGTRYSAVAGVTV